MILLALGAKIGFPRSRTVVLGLKHPAVAASALGAWVLSRIAYTVGYASGIPAKVCIFIKKISARLFLISRIEQRNNLVTQMAYIPAITSECIIFFGLCVGLRGITALVFGSVYSAYQLISEGI